MMSEWAEKAHLAPSLLALKWRLTRGSAVETEKKERRGRGYSSLH